MTTRKRDYQAVSVEECKQFVSVTVTCAAAENYTAGDVMSSTATGDAGAATEVELGDTYDVTRIKQIIALCSEDSVLNRLRLHFYDYNPAAADVEMDDNVAGDWAKNATARAGYLGSILLSAFADRGTSMAVSETDLIDKLLRTKVGSSKVYMVVETVDAETNETAAMTIRFDIYFD